MDTGWLQCYYLLLQALHGYNLTFDAKQFLKGKSGMDTGWHQCYYLLLQALHGYNLTLDAKQFLKGKSGMATGWHQCYYLLLQALHGYNLTLDAKQFLKGKPCYCDTSGMGTTSPSTLSSSSKVSHVTVTRLVWVQPHPRR